MRNQTLVLLVATLVLGVLARSAVEAVYPCCCQRVNPDCGEGCYLCYNSVYQCNCERCSCYSSPNQGAADYMRGMLRVGGGRPKWGPRAGRQGNWREMFRTSRWPQGR